MRVLVTGSSGFVGSHLCELATERGAEVFGPTRTELDLHDAAATRALVRSVRPDLVFHLAALASVAESWNSPAATIEANVSATVNVLDGVREEAPRAHVLVAGSGEIYGRGTPATTALTESAPPDPQSPYAVSKLACDFIAGVYAEAYGTGIVRTRAFNHAGPGQPATYVTSAFAEQVARAEADGLASLDLSTGDLRPRRDFCDVRDVVRAYWDLTSSGATGVFNVCRGETIAIADIVAALDALTEVNVVASTDPAKLRPNEVFEIRGSREKLTTAVGWEPAIAMEQTVADTLDWWREQVGSG